MLILAVKQKVVSLLYVEKKKITHHIFQPEKTPVQVIQKPHIKPYILNPIEEKLRKSLERIATGDSFLNKAVMVQALRSTIHKRDLT